MSYHEISKFNWLSTKNRQNLAWEFYPKHIHILIVKYAYKQLNSKTYTHVQTMTKTSVKLQNNRLKTD